MTALDDALDTPSPVWVQPELIAFWIPGNGYDGDTSIEDLGEQLDETLTVDHSLDDGLPDPVTLTGQNNASGTLSAVLLGKSELKAATIDWRAASSYGSTTALDTSILVTQPANWVEGDLILLAVSVPSAMTVFPVAFYDDWVLLGSFTDGATLGTYIFGGVYTDTGTQINLGLSGATAWAMVATAAYALTVDGRRVPLRFGPVVGGAEAASVTAHVTPATTLTKRGCIASVWSRVASAAGWTAPAGDTELGEAFGTAATNADVALAVSPMVYPDVYVKTGTSGTATAVATMVGIPVEIVDRPAMTAREYFSIFNADSPIVDFDRDTAVMQFEWGTMTANGPEYTTLLWGQMADIALKGDTAELSMVSETRLDLMTSVVPPVVWGTREGGNLTWLMTWLLSQAGYFLSYAPDVVTRIWAPLHGSVHPHFDGEGSYCYALRWDALGFNPQRPPTSVDGPFVKGMFACQNDTEAQMLFLNMRPSPYIHPVDEQPYGTAFLYDQMSAASAWGRIQMWVRGDYANPTPTAYTPTSVNSLVDYTLQAVRVGGFVDALVNVNIRAADRKLKVLMGDQTAGYLELASSLVLPTDGAWHFVGFSWNWKTGETRFRMDATSQTYSGVGFVTTDAQLPTTDAAYRLAGNDITNSLFSKLPISEIEIGSGSPAHGNPFFIDDPMTDNAVGRPVATEFEVIAFPTAGQAWDMLSDLARNTLSAYRTDETDLYNFLPLGYFGEVAQQTPQVVILDTDENLSVLDITNDPTKIRNVVTVEFSETRANDRYSPALEYSTVEIIPRGISTFTFALDSESAEIHNAPSAIKPVVATNLTATQVTNKTWPTNIHWVTLNSLADGSGTYYTGTDIVVSLIGATAFTVTVQFNNKTNAARYLANNGDQVPFLNVYGYIVTTTPGYETRRDDASVAKRHERALSIQLPMIQTRFDAGQAASNLVAMLCNPRGEIAVTAMGDPRRAPGQLVTVADAQGTKAMGNWRVLSVKHNRNGPSYTQDLTLVQVLPPSTWDGVYGWDLGVWGE